MNLHQIVRPAIRAINPDIVAQYLKSTGNSSDSSGRQTPAYAAAVPVTVQVQPVNSKDLQHIDFLNLQGEFRALYLYGEAVGIVRLQQKGGDLFQFAAFAGDPIANWLVVDQPESWNVNAGGFSRVIVQLQADVL